MAEPPKSDYDQLRSLESQKSEAAPEQPTRPDTIRSTGGPRSGGMEQQQRFATEYNKAAQQQRQQQRQPDSKLPERQPEKSKIEQAAEKQKAIREVAEKLAPRTMDRAERDRER